MYKIAERHQSNYPELKEIFTTQELVELLIDRVQ